MGLTVASEFLTITVFQSLANSMAKVQSPQQFPRECHEQNICWTRPVMLAAQAEMKTDNYHYFISFVFPPDERLWGMHICACLRAEAFRGPLHKKSRGTQPAS